MTDVRVAGLGKWADHGRTFEAIGLIVRVSKVGVCLLCTRLWLVPTHFEKSSSIAGV